MRQLPRSVRIYALLAIALSLWFLPGCPKPPPVTVFSDDFPGAGGNTPVPSPRFFAVLCDETGSFGEGDTQQGTWRHYWPEVLDLVSRAVIPSIDPGDAFVFIGVDDHGYDADDARVNVTILDQSVMKAIMQKKELAAKVRALKRRERSRGSDMLGALAQTAALCAGLPTHRPILIAFMDMVQQDASGNEYWPTPDQACQAQFPQGAQACFLYVNASGASKWDTLIQHWGPLVEAMGLDVSSPQLGGKARFYQRAESESALSEFLSWVGSSSQSSSVPSHPASSQPAGFLEGSGSSVDSPSAACPEAPPAPGGS